MKNYFALFMGIFLSICFLGFLFFYTGNVPPKATNPATVASLSGNVSSQAVSPAKAPPLPRNFSFRVVSPPKAPPQSGNVPSRTIDYAKVESQSGNVSPKAINPATVPSQSGNVPSRTIDYAKVESQSGNVPPKAITPVNVTPETRRAISEATNRENVASQSNNVQLSAAYAEEFPSKKGEKQSEEFPSRKEARQSGEQIKAVHAIGVYHGDYPEGNKKKGGTRPDGIVEVTVKHNPDASPVTLILMSYEPVEWRIRKEYGAKVEKIILSSYLPGKVTGIDNVPVLRESIGYAYERMGFIRINMKIRDITGSEAKTFQGGYHGKYFDVY
jgi:hypothetical protein